MNINDATGKLLGEVSFQGEDAVITWKNIDAMNQHARLPRDLVHAMLRAETSTPPLGEQPKAVHIGPSPHEEIESLRRRLALAHAMLIEELKPT